MSTEVERRQVKKHLFSIVFTTTLLHIIITELSEENSLSSVIIGAKRIFFA
jgi:hypothetical protein